MVNAMQMNDTQSEKWQIIGASVKGATHDRKGLPNQDAIDWRSESEDGFPLILALSDGHGSSKSFRSHQGSRFAVKIAIDAFRELAEYHAQTPGFTEIKRMAEEQLPKEIVRNWKKAVEEDIAQNPFSDEDCRLLPEHDIRFKLTEHSLKLLEEEGAPEEILTRLRPLTEEKEIAGQEKFLRAVEAKIGDDAAVQYSANILRHVSQDRSVVYGATLLTVFMTPAFIIYFQLGDGDILTISADGRVERPLPKDDRLFANETTSLCMKDAWRDVRFRFQPLFELPPALVLAATDGYANSFADDEGFLKVGADLLAMLHHEGAEYVREHLAGWLQEASQAGSGDDITVGLIYHNRCREKFSESDEHEQERDAPAVECHNACQQAESALSVFAA